MESSLYLHRGDVVLVNSLELMKNGDEIQFNAYSTILELNICNDLQKYNPVLCGTFPLGLNVKGSDLDMIMEVYQLDHFTSTIKNIYGKEEHFRVKAMKIRGRDVIKANFSYNDFDFELFGQPQPVTEQYAFLHMKIENELLKADPTLKENVIRLKNHGLNTEAAFCEILGISGDPYDGLIRFGIQKEYINVND